MTNKELLSAIEKRFDGIDARFESVEAKIGSMETRIDSMDAKIEVMDAKIESMDDKFETKIDSLDKRFSSLENQVTDIKQEIVKIKILNENEILPRLIHIESCYLSTYDRYRTSVDTYETMQDDIYVLKRVVRDHSIKLQEIS